MNDEAVEALPCERGRTGEKALAARFAGFGRAVSRRLSEANPPQDPKGERDDAAAGAKKRGRQGARHTKRQVGKVREDRRGRA